MTSLNPSIKTQEPANPDSPKSFFLRPNNLYGDIKMFETKSHDFNGAHAVDQQRDHLDEMIMAIRCSQAEAKFIRGEFRKGPPAEFWDKVSKAWARYTFEVEQMEFLNLGPLASFLPIEPIQNCRLIFMESLEKEIGEAPDPSPSNWLVEALSGRPFPPAALPSRPLPFQPSPNVWLTLVHTFWGQLAPLVVHLETPMKPPLPGETILLESPEFACWAPTITGPSLSLSLDQPGSRNLIRALDHSSLAWREKPLDP